MNARRFPSAVPSRAGRLIACLLLGAVLTAADAGSPSVSASRRAEGLAIAAGAIAGVRLLIDWLPVLAPPPSAVRPLCCEPGGGRAAALLLRSTARP